jgi:hypothetical protein
MKTILRYQHKAFELSEYDFVKFYCVESYKLFETLSYSIPEPTTVLSNITCKCYSYSWKQQLALHVVSIPMWPVILR